MEELGQPRNVTARQLGQMLVLVPVMIHWLRDVGPDSGSLIVKDVTVDVPAVQSILLRILDALNFSGDLTIQQVRELGESVGDKVWAAAVRKIVIDSEPALIPPSVGSELMKISGDIPQVKQALDRLTRTQYFALAEVCALFHDCGDAELAALVGSRIVVHTGHSETGSEQSTAVMKQLINQCEILFGRSAGASATSQKALGGQTGQRASTLAGTGSSVLPVVSVADALMTARKHALKAFLQWKDESKVESVDELFDNHSFVDIARGVWARYDVLPGGWRGELEEMRDKGIAEAAWVPQDGKSLSPSDQQQTTPGSSLVSMIPQDVGPRAARRTLGGFTRASRASIHEPAPPMFSNLNLLINEIVDSEIFYYSVLKELQDTYVTELREIAAGARGAEAQAALGISLNDVESVFGWRLAQVIETSKSLLAKLEVINLIRQEVKHPGGRAMFVAKAFAAVAPNLSVNYAPFVSGHRHGMNVLNQGTRPMSTRDRPMSMKLNMIGSRFSSRALLTMKDNGIGNQSSFISLWQTLTANSKRLRGQSLQSIMIMPIQRIPRYKLLLAELDKKLPPDHLCRPVLGTAFSQVSSVAQQINQALRQHEKLENLVGAGDMPEIAGAKSLMKNGSMRLTVNYKTQNTAH